MKLGRKNAKIYNDKHKINKLIYNFLNNNSDFENFKINEIKFINNISNEPILIEGKLYYKKKRIYNDYLDNFLLDYNNYLALNLSDINNKNIYFNIINGEILVTI
tara:strand:- start:219 stop:533 length:315 start_codon:yes stop_codon:yes gene_type:complete